MKATLFGLVLALTLTGVWSAAAGDKAKSNKDAKAAKSTAQQKEKSDAAKGIHKEKMLLTGSYIERDVRRSGLITDGPSQVQVLDTTNIRTSGATDVRQLLNRFGVH